MRNDGKEQIKYNFRSAARLFFYGVISVLGVAALTVMLNMFFLLAVSVVYVNMDSSYIKGGDVMEALTLTDNGYVLDEEMKEEFEREDQWAMLLNEDGQVVWSIRRPDELETEYSRSDIARMTRWYLKGYPVHLRVWDDRIMIVGMQKDVMWKYDLEFTISWMEFTKRTFLAFFLINFAGIVVLTFFFTRRFTKNREQARIEWIAAISHDIRTPLSMVMGYADTLEHNEDLAEEARRQAAVIRHQSIVMKELISDLNLTSRLEHSMQALKKERVCPAEIVRGVAASFLNDSTSGMLEMEVEIEETKEIMAVNADRQLLVRVFRNLINNSVKHGGQTDVVKIRISLREEKGRCCIRFQDNGVGYPEEVIRRLRSGKSEHTTGNIRGLEIVRRIIEAHGGKIWFRNCEDGGSCCLIALRKAKV